jgi:hypothetical protein
MVMEYDATRCSMRMCQIFRPPSLVAYWTGSNSRLCKPSVPFVGKARMVGGRAKHCRNVLAAVIKLVHCAIRNARAVGHVRVLIVTKLVPMPLVGETTVCIVVWQSTVVALAILGNLVIAPCLGFAVTRTRACEVVARTTMDVAIAKNGVQFTIPSVPSAIRLLDAAFAVPIHPIAERWVWLNPVWICLVPRKSLSGIPLQ